MLKKKIVHTFVGNFSQMGDGFCFEFAGEAPQLRKECFLFSECYTDLSAKNVLDSVTSIETKGNRVLISVTPFLFIKAFAVTYDDGAIRFTVNKEEFDVIEVKNEDMFRPVICGDVRYRIYEPEASGPRPLILYLHGGGGSGEDNRAQMTDTLGPNKLAERFTDMYVMAPQAPSRGLNMQQTFQRMLECGDPYRVDPWGNTNNLKTDSGWTREYLAKVAEVIRTMIKEGKVDSSRIYLTGLSMGGGGSLKMLSVAPELFASAVVICPSMNGETYPILYNLPDVPIYLATSYIDHSVARHAYIMRAVQHLWDQGREVRYTIFAPEELEKYGIGLNKDIPQRALYEENHMSWVLVYNNEYGILDWMSAHRKN